MLPARGSSQDVQRDATSGARLGTPAEFEEKTYETAANIEFDRLGDVCQWPQCGLCHLFRTVEVWSPGQALEEYVGFDSLVNVAAAHPRIADILGIAVPPGTDVHRHWPNRPAVESAPDWASLFLQYKRPTLLRRRHGVFKHLFDGPYYRFDLRARQHESLCALRDSTIGEALVCYAAPRFHTNNAYRSAVKHSAVLDRSVFIEATGPDHTHGAYDDSATYLCSEPERADPLSLRILFERMAGRPNDRAELGWEEGFASHVRVLATAVRQAREGLEDWWPAGNPTTSLPESQGLVEDMLAILDFAYEHNVTWLLNASYRRGDA